ncbi:hypothetical protein C8J56DRAFT_916841 [Mycena floridula]|nr:hypothetical protein C8J56DRAFT_916841 [Mycena floridula]
MPIAVILGAADRRLDNSLLARIIPTGRFSDASRFPGGFRTAGGFGGWTAIPSNVPITLVRPTSTVVSKASFASSMTITTKQNTMVPSAASDNASLSPSASSGNLPRSTAQASLAGDHSRNSLLSVILGSVLGVLFVLLALMFLWYRRRRRRQNNVTSLVAIPYGSQTRSSPEQTIKSQGHTVSAWSQSDSHRGIEKGPTANATFSSETTFSHSNVSIDSPDALIQENRVLRAEIEALRNRQSLGSVMGLPPPSYSPDPRGEGLQL